MAQIPLGIVNVQANAHLTGINFVRVASANCFGPTCAVTISPSTGDHVIVWMTTQTAAISAFSDNATGGSTTYTDSGITGSAGGVFPRVWYVCSVKGGATTLTATAGSTGTDMTVTVLEYSGGLTSSCLDASTSSIKTGITQTAQTANAITPASGVNEVVIGFFWQATNDTTGFATSGSWTLRNNVAEVFGNMVAGVTDQIVSSTSGSYTAAASTSAGVNYGGLAASFK